MDKDRNGDNYSSSDRNQGSLFYERGILIGVSKNHQNRCNDKQESSDRPEDKRDRTPSTYCTVEDIGDFSGHEDQTIPQIRLLVPE